MTPSTAGQLAVEAARQLDQGRNLAEVVNVEADAALAMLKRGEAHRVLAFVLKWQRMAREVLNPGEV